MHEGPVEVRTLESGHAAVRASLPVEHELQSNPGATDHGAADEELAHQQAIVLLGLGVRLVLVTAAGALETSEEAVGSGLLGDERGSGRPRGEEIGGLGRRLVESPDGGGRTARGLCELGNPRSQARRPSADGEGKRHYRGCDAMLEKGGRRCRDVDEGVVVGASVVGNGTDANLYRRQRKAKDE